jgi:hypothetical protein
MSVVRWERSGNGQSNDCICDARRWPHTEFVARRVGRSPSKSTAAAIPIVSYKTRRRAIAGNKFHAMISQLVSQTKLTGEIAYAPAWRGHMRFRPINFLFLGPNILSLRTLRKDCDTHEC